jgi:hypothetical protein
MDSETDTPNPKCVSCRCYWVPDNDDIKSSGCVYKSCRRCRKPKLTAEDIRVRQNANALLYRMKKKAALYNSFK